VSYCPFCEQGIVCRAKVGKLDCFIYICDECDTIWRDGVELVEGNGQSFDGFMKANGLEPLWSELTDIERDWDK
jgi:ribosomal protein L37AE/L43A